MSHPYSKANEILKACWEGYKMIGTKEKDGKTVPNCVPKKKAEEAPEESKKQERIAGGTVAVPSAGGMLAREEKISKGEGGEAVGQVPFIIRPSKSMPDADFHIHSIGDKAGKPAEEASATTYGVKANPNVFVPQYLKYMFDHAHMTGRFKPYIKGSVISRVNVGDVHNAIVEHMMHLYGVKKSEDGLVKDEKKYSKKVTNPETGREKTVRYGAKGYTIAPGTSRGDSYCARSAGQMKDHPAAAKDPNSPLRLSRKKWKCKGSKSTKKSEEDVIEVDPAEYLAKTQELLSILRKSTDHEYAGRMVKGNLYKLAETAQKLYPLFQDDENVEPWVEEKIAVAASMMDSVAHYMEHEAVADGKAPDETGIVTGE